MRKVDSKPADLEPHCLLVFVLSLLHSNNSLTRFKVTNVVKVGLKKRLLLCETYDSTATVTVVKVGLKKKILL